MRISMKTFVRGLLHIWLLVSLMLPAVGSPALADEPTRAASAAQAVTDSLPATGTSYKIKVDADGIYRITYADLAAVGLPVDTVDPRTFKIWEQGTEIAIYVEGEADGSFDPGDAILFYGKMARTRYQDPNIYWLTYGGSPGLRMGSRDVTPGSAPLVSDYPRLLHLEENANYWRDVPMEPNADHWYWKSYNAFECTTIICFATRAISVTVPISTASSLPHTALLRPRVRGVSDDLSRSPDHHVVFYVNDTYVGDAYWDGQNAFTGEFTFSQSLLISGTNVISFYVPLDIVDNEYGLLNWVELEYYDRFIARGDALDFTIPETGDRRVTITNFSDPNILLFDITDPQHPVRLLNATVAPSGGSYALTFQDNVATAENAYLAAAEPAIRTPSEIVLDTPSDLKNPANGADWIVITHAAFRAQAEQLAAHRASFSGLRTMVVDVQDVYDEFSGGLLDPEAIRQFIAYAYTHWQPPAPRYVVLFGDGELDYKDYNKYKANKQFIPPYLDLVDCFLGETAADNRYVAGPRTNPNRGALECQKHAMPFMAIGRLPANNTAEAETMVYRIICYENPGDPICSGGVPPAGWDTRAIFVADDNDNAGAFTCHSDEVAGQQRCPDQDFGFRPGTARAAARSPALRVPEGANRDLRPLAVVNTQVTGRAGFIGDYIWLDANGNGWPDASESGIDGVVVNLWEDVDNDGTLSPADRYITSVTSGDNPHTSQVEHGWYGFDGLDKANYLVEIDASNFAPGGALEGLVLSKGQNPWPVHMDGLIPDEYVREKIYLKDESSPGVVPYPDGTSARSALISAINSGAAFVTYNGHSTTTTWAGEKILNVNAISNLTNTSAWPVFLPMTCLEGQFHQMTGAGLSESLVRAVNDSGMPVGAVAAWGPTGLGIATGHTYLYTGFFEAVFHKGILTIGDAILYAKRKLYESDSPFKDLLETYTLFGDPAMRLRVPLPDVAATKVVEPPGIVQPGDVVTYTVTVSNDGPITAFDVTITDTLPASLIPQSWSAEGLPLTLEPGSTYVWHVAEMAPGDRVTITVVAQIDPSTPTGAPIVNRLEARSGSADANPNNNTASTTSDVGGRYSIGGLAYEDTNGSRAYEHGEHGMAGVLVSLSDATGLLATTTTDATGFFTFTNLIPGTYTVTVTAPAGFIPTTETTRAVTITDTSELGLQFGFISPTGVSLANVEVRPTALGVEIRWTAWDEQGVTGYHIYRGRTSEAMHRITARPIPARGAPKATYSLEDHPLAGGEWYYWVEAVGAQGAITRVGPFVARNVSVGHHIFSPWIGR